MGRYDNLTYWILGNFIYVFNVVGSFSGGIIFSCANRYAALITTFLLILEDCITTIYFYKYKHIKHIQS
jgi:hypothetical protein